MRDVIKKIPKLRGYRFASIEKPYVAVNLDMLDTAFAVNDTVTPVVLLEKKVITKKNGKTPKVKILARGTLSKKLTITGCTVSAVAKTAIEKVGGTVA